MATQEFQYVQDILKEWYAPAIVNQIYVKSPFWAVVKKTSKGVSGKRVYIPLRHTLSEAVGALKAGEYTLPTAGKIGYDSTYVWQKRNYGRVQVDGLAIEASKGKGGWIDVFTGETRGIAESFAIDIDRQVMGRGTAVIGHATEDISGTTTDAVTVDNPAGITLASPGYMWFRKSMKIAIFDSVSASEINGDDAGIAALEISAIDPANNLVTFQSGAGTEVGAVSDGDLLIRRFADDYTARNSLANCDADAANAGVGDIMGLDRIVDDDTGIGITSTELGVDAISFQGINATVAAQNWWRAQRLRTSNTILTEMKIQEDLDTIENNTDGDSPNLALTTKALRNKLIEIVKSDKMVQGINFIAGWEGIKYRGGAVSLPIMVHKFCPTGYWYYLNMKYIRFYTLKKLIWDSSGGGIIKPVAGEDQYEAWFKMYGNLGVDKRNAFGKATHYTTS